MHYLSLPEWCGCPAFQEPHSWLIMDGLLKDLTALLEARRPWLHVAFGCVTWVSKGEKHVQGFKQGQRRQGPDRFSFFLQHHQLFEPSLSRCSSLRRALVPITEGCGLEGTLNTTWFHSPPVDRDPFHQTRKDHPSPKPQPGVSSRSCSPASPQEAQQLPTSCFPESQGKTLGKESTQQGNCLPKEVTRILRLKLLLRGQLNTQAIKRVQ